MKTLVIGGQGTLGRPVVRRLIRDGLSVRVMARAPERARSVLPPEVEAVKGDLENVDSIRPALAGCDAVYVSVDTRPKASFRAETQGLANVAAAARAEGVAPRLLVLSAVGTSSEGKQTSSWWHVAEKVEAQRIARESGLPWTIFEPSWLWESIPLFIKGKTFASFNVPGFAAYWVSGDDYGRMISAALSRDVGRGEVVPAQGPDRLGLEEAGRRFIQAYDPSIRVRKVPFWMVRLLGLLNADIQELVQLFGMYSRWREPAPVPDVWERFGKPRLDAAGYAAYVRETGDFPQKG